MLTRIRLERARRQLLEAAAELKQAAPLAAMRASALARELEMQIDELEAGLVR